MERRRVARSWSVMARARCDQEVGALPLTGATVAGAQPAPRQVPRQPASCSSGSARWTRLEQAGRRGLQVAAGWSNRSMPTRSHEHLAHEDFDVRDQC